MQNENDAMNDRDRCAIISFTAVLITLGLIAFLLGQTDVSVVMKGLVLVACAGAGLSVYPKICASMHAVGASADKALDAAAARASEDAAKAAAAKAAAAKAAAEKEAAEKAAAAAAAKAAAEAAAAEAAAAEAAPAAPAGTAPTKLDGPRDGQADDLKKIKGVGPKLEELLHSMGFYHFDQIAAWTADEVAWVDENLEGFKGRVTRDDWVAQAGTLASGGETEFSKRVEDGDVPSSQ